MQDKPHIDYSPEKNLLLKETRGISFEEIEVAIEEGNLLDVIMHPNIKRYPNQKMYVVKINNYIYLVPFVRQGDTVFLKTIFPSRKLTKKYLKQNCE